MNYIEGLTVEYNENIGYEFKGSGWIPIERNTPHNFLLCLTNVEKLSYLGLNPRCFLKLSNGIPLKLVSTDGYYITLKNSQGDIIQTHISAIVNASNDENEIITNIKYNKNGETKVQRIDCRVKREVRRRTSAVKSREGKARCGVCDN